jgi:hypothetical protein
VPRSAIDQRFFDSPYYVMPSEPVGQEAFAVIREAMRGKRMVALGRLVLAKRERVIALDAYDKGLLGTTLRYPYEVRKAEDYFCDLPDLTIAPDISRWPSIFSTARASEFEPATFRDRYEEALLAHLKAKQAGAVPERRKTFSPQCERQKRGEQRTQKASTRGHGKPRPGRSCDNLGCCHTWNLGRHECTGQPPHSWKSASDLKSTATFRPSSDHRRTLL